MTSTAALVAYYLAFVLLLRAACLWVAPEPVYVVRRVANVEQEAIDQLVEEWSREIDFCIDTVVEEWAR